MEAGHKRDLNGQVKAKAVSDVTTTTISSSSSSSSSSSAFKYRVTSGAYGNRGLKAQLEDVEVQVADLSGLGSEELGKHRSAFFGIFDGHAGRHAADFCAENLARLIAEKIDKPTDNESVRRAIMQGFRDADAKFLAMAEERGLKDGCTAVTVTVVRDVMFVGWVGDSKAVLARRETEEKSSRLKVLSLTRDHTAMQAKERERIVRAGGFVENNRVNGIMEVSRSIGDAQLKKAGVSSSPDIERVTLTDRDEFLLLACDGLWRVMDAKEAIERAREALREDNSPEEVCMQLVREAIRNREVTAVEEERRSDRVKE